MKITSVLLISASMLFLSCSNSESSNEEAETWTENQEIHFYNDCSDKMMAQGMDDEETHEFCVCCLLKLKEEFSSGQEAMDKLSDEDIVRMENACLGK